MRVFDPDAGYEAELRWTDALGNEMAAAGLNTFCRHQDKELRRHRTADGRVQARRQCLTCGKMLGHAVSRDSVPADVPFADEQLADRYDAARDAQCEAIMRRHVQLQRAERIEWRRRYDSYLATPWWRAKCDKVLRRADGMCEGCGDRPATEVHHLTYKHVFNEFLFELVALCSPCHRKVHGHEESRAPEPRADAPVAAPEAAAERCTSRTSIRSTGSRSRRDESRAGRMPALQQGLQQ